jgi:hypothetical protein
MKKLPLLLATGLIFISCTRRYECSCDYKQRTFELNTDNVLEEVITNENYLSYISYTSKKLATTECDERGSALMQDTLKIEATCKISKYKP